MYEHLDVTQERDVLHIAFDRPEKRNVVDATMHTELVEVFEQAQQTDARVVLLTGNGKTFCSGGDAEWMSAFLEDPTEWQEVVAEGYDLVQNLVDIERPVVAKVNGDAIAVGATIALFCDITVASEDARIGDMHTSMGLAAGDGGAVIWPLLANVNRAKELLMTGETITATEAEEYGLFNHVVSPAELDAKTDDVIDRLASRPEAALRYTKISVNNWLQLGIDAILRESLALEGLSMQTADHREAVEAFHEERAPEFPSARIPDDE